jgi:hypothetical protein
MNHRETHCMASTSPDLKSLEFLPLGTTKNFCVRVSSSC